MTTRRRREPEVPEESAQEECEGNEKSVDELDEVNIVEELPQQEGLMRQESLTARRQEGGTQRYPQTFDASEQSPVGSEGQKGGKDENLEDQETGSWYEDRNWWLGGVVAV